MGRKIFISYKYKDTSVLHLARSGYFGITKVRDYVDEFQEKLSETDHLNKGEKDGEDLSAFKDSTIESKLRDKIYDSSVTVVLISPNMKEKNKKEEEQWIPWEISYSLKEVTRQDRTSRTNGILAVVIPDQYGSYDYALEPRYCCSSGCTIWHQENLFSIIRDNMFNRKNDNGDRCSMGRTIYHGFVSYIHMVRWDYFINNIDTCLDIAIGIRDNKDNYELHKVD